MLKFKIKDISTDNEHDILDENNWAIDQLKFVVFEYIIPRPIFPPIKRISKIYCMNRSDKVGHLGLKYSIYNFIVCWIGLPFSPVEMISANRKNKTGIELTEEISSKITMADIQRGQMILPAYEADFIKLKKTIYAALNDSFTALKNESILTEAPVVGYVKFKSKHIFYLGLNEHDLSNSSDIKSYLSNVFDRRSEFVIIDKKESTPLAEKLMSEGTIIN